MTVKLLRCKDCEEITEHYLLKGRREYIHSMIGGSLGGNWGGRSSWRTDSKLIYKCTKCGKYFNRA